MKIITEFPRQVTEIEDMGIVMPDGIRLSARVWMPEDASTDPVPAVLEYIPYRKRDGTIVRDEMMHPYVAGHGYASVRVDMRGNGDSEGLMADEYTEQEMLDAEAVIAWLAAQPWCNGCVGMMGKSWGGFNCLQAAFRRPEALKAVISVCSTTDRFADDVHFKGGCMLGENLGWGAVMLSYSSRPADPLLRPDWREDWLARLEAEPFLTPRWASHQKKDAYWKHGSVGEDWSAIQAAILSIGGWADNYMNTVSHLVAKSDAVAQGIVGPWVHQYPHTAVPGPQIGFLQVAIRWWDRWLKGVENGAENDPAMRAWMIHSDAPDASAKYRKGHWVAEAEWPSPRLTMQQMDFAPGVLGADEPEPFAIRIATPQHLGLSTGEYFPMGLNAEMPADQRHDDAMSVCFDSDVLDAPLDLLGQAVVRLQLTSDKPRAFVAVRLNDVAPDGSSVRIAHGVLNLCHRDSMEEPTLLPVGDEVSADVVIDDLAYRLAEGHRLRVAISNSYWPFLWPSPEAAVLTLTEGGVSLPVHSGSANEWTPPEPEAATPWQHEMVKAPSAARRVETDLISGRVALVVEEDTGDARNAAHGLVSGDAMTERWEIDPADPLSAKVRITWQQRRSRDDWRIRTEAWVEMTGDTDHLHMTARLEAYEGDTMIFARDFTEKVARDFI